MDGRTPLMAAALNTALETIDTLLRLGADADLLMENNKPALYAALQTGNLATVKKLLPVTNNGPVSTFKCFANTSVPFINEIKEFLTRNLEGNEELFLVGLVNSAMFGNDKMVNVLWDFLSRHRNKKYGSIMVKLPDIIKNAIRSDSFDVCQKIKLICTHFKYETGNLYKELAISRSYRNITNLFATNPMEGDDSLLIDNLIKQIQEKNFENIYDILNLIPKTDEFPYYPEMRKILELIKENETEDGCVLTFDKLIDRLHVKEIHPDVEDCPSACEQILKCQAIRECLRLINFLMLVAATEYPIFLNTAVQIVGSLKEGSKINELDEADVLLVLEKEPYENLLEFDQENQKVKFVERKPRKDHPLEPFRTPENNFDHKFYFFTFVQIIYNIISNMGSMLPEMLNLTMDPLTTDFVPCTTCINTDRFQPYFKRCRHRPGCKKHGKAEECDCDVFTSPSLTYSKIGI